MFPRISHIDDLLPHIEHNKQIRVKAETFGHTVISYMVQDEDTFAGAAPEYARECRGITFHPDGTISARTLHKFFNVGEREDTQPHNLVWSNVDRIMDKRDGSMVTPVLVNDSIKFKTKKSFSTPEAALADELCASPDRCNWVKKLLQDGFTPTFEVTSPRFPIVIRYDTDELTLLHIRENATGRYFTEKEIAGFTPPFPIVINQAERFKRKMYALGGFIEMVDWDLLKKAAEETTDIEGWVIQFESGEMVKLKTAWYSKLHHSVTFTRWRDIARTAVADQTDDLKGAFAMTGRSIEPILVVERKIRERIDTVSTEVRARAEAGIKNGLSAKEMAEQWKADDNFGLIMRRFRGQEINWMEWYAKNHLESDWNLEVVAVNA